jgi:hypothetical protein
MSLRSRITGSEDTDQTTDQTVTDETAADGTAVRPTFTPAPDDSDGVVDDSAVTDETQVPRPVGSVDDVAAQEPTISEQAVPTSAVAASDYSEPVSVEPEQTARAYETAPAAGSTVAGTTPASAYAATPAATSMTAATSTPGEPVTGKHAAPASGAILDGPLFTENPELRGQWQHIQAEFVDDPQTAVADAADLVQQAGQALVSTLQQRQSQMRAQWDRSQASGSADPTASEVTTTGGVDTEQLRQIMQRYRALFDQLSQPV